MSEIVVTQHENGRIINANREDIIKFRLQENLTTGYGWEVETEGSVVELIESTYIESPGVAMGCGGTRVLCFVARSPGRQEIRLRLRRPWDPPIVLEHLEVTIKVQ